MAGICTAAARMERSNCGISEIQHTLAVLMWKHRYDQWRWELIVMKSSRVMQRERLLYGILEETGDRMKSIWEGVARAKQEKVIPIVSIRCNREGGLPAVAWSRRRFKRSIFRRTLEHLQPWAITEPFIYGIRSAKILEIFWIITRSQNSGHILLEVIAYMQKYHPIAGTCVRRDRTDLRSFLIQQHGN